MRWLVLMATAGMIAVNGLANALPINGKTTGEISGGFDILFTPPGYVFAIWGLIYSGLVGFAVWQALPRHAQRPDVSSIRPWFLLNTLGNSGWILAWHYEQFFVSWVVMLVIAATLAAIHRTVSEDLEGGPAAALFLRAPFSLYFGWITVATLANTTVLLHTMGFEEVLADPGWTLAIVALATTICVSVSFRTRDPIYAGVFVWALSGIARGSEMWPVLSMGAWVATGVCATAAIVRARRRTSPR